MSSDAGQLQFAQRRSQSADGTHIAYYVGGQDRAAPALLIATDPASPCWVWRHLLGYLGDRLRLITWDWRGHRRSEPAKRRHGYGVGSQLDDLRAVMRSEALDQTALLGWGMGAQVAVEAYRELRERVSCLVLVAGAAGRPLDGIPGGRGMIAQLAGWSERGGGAAAVSRGLIARWLRRRARMLDGDVVRELGADLEQLDASAYLETLQSMARHDAFDALREVRAPSLVVAGGRDPLTPAAALHQVARHLACSEMFVVRRGGHYLFLEYPDLVNLHLERFFEDVGIC